MLPCPRDSPLTPAPGCAGAAGQGIYAVLLLVSPRFISPPEQSLPDPAPALTPLRYQEAAELQPMGHLAVAFPRCWHLGWHGSAQESLLVPVPPASSKLAVRSDFLTPSSPQDNPSPRPCRVKNRALLMESSCWIRDLAGRR